MFVSIEGLKWGWRFGSKNEDLVVGRHVVLALEVKSSLLAKKGDFLDVADAPKGVAGAERQVKVDVALGSEAAIHLERSIEDKETTWTKKMARCSYQSFTHGDGGDVDEVGVDNGVQRVLLHSPFLPWKRSIQLARLLYVTQPRSGHVPANTRQMNLLDVRRVPLDMWKHSCEQRNMLPGP